MTGPFYSGLCRWRNTVGLGLFIVVRPSRDAMSHSRLANPFAGEGLCEVATSVAGEAGAGDPACEEQIVFGRRYSGARLDQSAWAVIKEERIRSFIIYYSTRCIHRSRPVCLLAYYSTEISVAGL